MRIEYPVMSEKVRIGSAVLQSEGMLWKFTCTCDANEGDQVVVCMSFDGEEKELGTCYGNVPLVKRIPKRMLVQENLRFYIKQNSEDRIFIDPKEEIENISRLRYARVQKDGDRYYLLFDQSNSSPTGQ